MHHAPRRTGTSARPTARTGLRWLVAALAAALALALTACGSDSDPAGTAALTDQGLSRADVLALAEEEGSVSFYTTMAAPTADALADAFEKAYPGITVEVFANNADVVVSKVTSEHQAGKPGADVLEIDNFALQPLQERGVVQPFYSAAAGDLPAEVKKAAETDGENYYVNDRVLYISLGYNSDEVTEVPTTLDDLLAPDLKGRLAFAEGTVAARWVGGVLHTLGGEEGTAFIEELGAQDVKLAPVTTAALADLLVAGQYDATPALLSNAPSTRADAPIAWAAVGLPVASTGSVSVVKGAEHPAAAALLSDFLIGPEGQAVFTSKGYASPAEAPDFESWDPLETYRTSDDFQQAYGEWQGLLDEYVY